MEHEIFKFSGIRAWSKKNTVSEHLSTLYETQTKEPKKQAKMNQGLLCVLIFVSITTSHSSWSNYDDYARRRQPNTYHYHDTRREANGLDDVATSNSMEEYDTFDAGEEESYREPRIGLEDGHRHIPVHPQPKEDRVEPPSRQQLETHINYNTVPGTAGVDYPSHAYVPLTTFYCYNYQHPGYYADVEAGCQVFHVCDVDGRQDSFLCPKGTIFNQAYFICDWWFNVECGQAPNYYSANADLHNSPGSSSTQTTYSDTTAG